MKNAWMDEALVDIPLCLTFTFLSDFSLSSSFVCNLLFFRFVQLLVLSRVFQLVLMCTVYWWRVQYVCVLSLYLSFIYSQASPTWSLPALVICDKDNDLCVILGQPIIFQWNTSYIFLCFVMCIADTEELGISYYTSTAPCQLPTRLLELRAKVSIVYCVYHPYFTWREGVGGGGWGGDTYLQITAWLLEQWNSKGAVLETCY